MSVGSTLRRARRQIADIARARGAARSGAPANDFAPVPTVSAPSAVNQVRNGDLSHSVRTWNAGSAGDQDYECAHFFSHDEPAAGQQLDETTAATSSANKALKSSSHSAYDAACSDWDRANGYARLEGTKTLDLPLPGHSARPNVGTLYVGLRAAKRTSGVVVSDSVRLFCGVWDNTAGQRDWVTASSAFSVTASVRGTPGATVERRYKVYLYTDRGYTYISDEAVVAAAPADGQFSSSVDVYLTWRTIPGVLEAHVYRHDVAAGTYRLLEKTSGSSYADNGTSLPDSVSGYPSATFDRAKAYVATPTGDLAGLPVDGVDPSWATVFLNVPVPHNYNLGVTTDRQWLRLGLTSAATGDDHGILIDLVHLSYSPGAVYAPHPDDLTRTLSPAALPNGSNQGGVGSGGGGGGAGDGGLYCVEEHEPVAVFEGERMVSRPWHAVAVGARVFGGGVRPNVVVRRRTGGCESLLLVRAENGCQLLCTPAHRVITTRHDAEGRRAADLAPGDSIVTLLRGRVEVSRVESVADTGRPGLVGTFINLTPGNLYVAGRHRPRGPLARLLAFFRPRRPSGVFSHNRKDMFDSL